jgi:hypothetical protein
MNREEFLKEHFEILEKLKSITLAKSSDYAGDSDPFSNFRLCEFVKLCSTEAGIMVRIGDKYSRICNLLGKDEIKVKDESVQDTLLDLANYCIIAAILISSEKSK